MPLHIYGVVRGLALDESPPAGLHGEPVRLVHDGEFAAIVSTVPDDARNGRDELLAHARVLEDVIARHDVVPFRFGMQLPDDDEVRRGVLVEQSDRLSQVLDALKGTVQVTVKGFHLEDEALREVLRRSPRLKQARDRLAQLPPDATYYKQIELGEAIANDLTRLQAADAEQVVQHLVRHAADVSHGNRASVHQFLNAAFLVRRSLRDAFDTAMAELTSMDVPRWRIRYVGPQPAYSFIDEEGRRPAWA
jgi:Gas vesicle synthesis protein GvpL/GvpF